MASIQQRAVSAILTVIRARRKVTSVPEGEWRPRFSGRAAPARLREALFSDFNAVAELKQRWGLGADSIENWERLWRHNPALVQNECERPIGWILEAEGVVVGYLGNISLLYRYGERKLRAVTGHALVVEPAYRASGLSLVAAFYRQRSVDLYLTTSAIPEVGRIARSFKSDALPQADYETVLFWVLRSYSFAYTLMERLRLQPILRRMGATSASLVIGIDKFLHRRLPRECSSFTVSEIGVNDIGDDFQYLWLEKLDEGPRLFADRSPAVLRWHFEIPGDKGTSRVLCCRRNGELLGYAVIRSDPQPNGTRRSAVADILARQNDPEVLRALLSAAYDHAKQGGSYVLEVLGFPTDIRRVCLQWNPYSRKYPACPFYYKAADPMMHKTLSDGMAWYASPFDGDTTLIGPSFSSTLPPPGASALQIKTARKNNTASDITEQAQSEVR